eukprot:c4190_g1_i2.p1 GENE.c4190_g1_i2~~c4190_g1_i2.p1  ORF type:complete len:169 (-),score=26.81 c4190_g1_i2:75-581(-)
MLFGSEVDAHKFQECMSLFLLAGHRSEFKSWRLFADALDRFYQSGQGSTQPNTGHARIDSRVLSVALQSPQYASYKSMTTTGDLTGDRLDLLAEPSIPESAVPKRLARTKSHIESSKQASTAFVIDDDDAPPPRRTVSFGADKKAYAKAQQSESWGILEFFKLCVARR